LVEHRTFNAVVAGSSPARLTILSLVPFVSYGRGVFASPFWRGHSWRVCKARSLCMISVCALIVSPGARHHSEQGKRVDQT
jgi:hypothetical protein